MSPPREPDPEQRFFFAHVQKAAGTSLLKRLQRHFGPSEIYPDDSDQVAGPTPVLLVSHLVERYGARRDEIRVVTGHFPIRASELLGDRFTTLTLLREPVERTLSYLRHHQKLTPADRDRPLEELYEEPIRFHGLVHNHMTKMLSLTPEEMAAGDGLMTHVGAFTDDRLAAAKAQLETVDVIGLHHELDAFCDELTARFGWRLGPPVHANRTDPVPVPASFRARIAADNAMDVELYDHALALCRARGGPVAASGRP